MCSKHHEPGYGLCLTRRTVIKATARDPQCPGDICLQEAPGPEEDGVLFILYEFSVSYKDLKGFHRKISQEKKKKTVSLKTLKRQLLITGNVAVSL